MPSAANTSRWIVVGTLGALALALAWLLVIRGESYTVSAQFQDAGQLVEGGSVRVAGRAVGTISKIRLTDDGLAQVEMRISDGSVTPLRDGTRAEIRAVGQAGVANRYVALSPGSEEAAEIASGGVLAPEQTQGIVNLDAILNSFGPDERDNLRRLIANSSRVFAGSGARHFRRMLAELDPALAELDGLMGEVARDRDSIERLVRTASEAAGAISSRRDDLSSAVAASAQAMSAIAGERESLARLLDEAPAVLEQATGTLTVAADAVDELRPALRDVPAAAGPLEEFLERTSSMLPVAEPAIRQLRSHLPDLNATLRGLRPLEEPARKGLRSAGDALGDSRHVVRGTRIYGTDLLLGVLSGLAAIATANHTQYGHYARLEFTQPPQTAIGGSLAPLLAGEPLLPGLFDLRTGLNRRCPGGNTPPAPDGSSPWVPDRSLCSPEHNTPAFVNDPPPLLDGGGGGGGGR